jgi:NAD(P)H-nitrite reductase large subunit
VLTSTRVEGITSGNPLAVSLSNGETLVANLVISATGVAPNTQFLEGSGVDIEQGILVNERLESSVANLFAAGDVAQGRDFSTGDYTIQAIQPTAVDHGRVAASNMTSGHEQLHRGSLNMNVLDTMGLVSTSFGAWEGLRGGESAELNDPDRFQYLNLQFHDDVLVGANTLGHTDHIGVMRGLIQTGLHLGVWKDRLLDNPLCLMKAYVAATQGVGLTTKAFR